MKKLTTYFSKGELTLWGGSAGLILLSFFLFDRVNFMTLAASLIGTTSLISHRRMLEDIKEIYGKAAEEKMRKWLPTSSFFVNSRRSIITLGSC